MHGVAVLLLTARTVAWAYLALVAAALLSAPGGPLGPGLALAESALVITGDVQGLEVGGQGRLLVTLDNRSAETAAVQAVDVTVSGGGGQGCGAAALTVERWTGRLAVPARGSAQVELLPSVADRPACAGQTWDLQYAAS